MMMTYLLTSDFLAEINCGSPGILPNGWLEGTRTTLHAVVTFRCQEGMTFEGPVIELFVRLMVSDSCMLCWQPSAVCLHFICIHLTLQVDGLIPYHGAMVGLIYLLFFLKCEVSR